MELGHDVVDPLLEECPGSGKVRRCWWHRIWVYRSHEKGGSVLGASGEKRVVMSWCRDGGRRKSRDPER